MKTSLLRQAAVCRAAALGARPLHGAFRASSAAAVALPRPSRPVAALYRPAASSLLRFYSAESAASADSTQPRDRPITRFPDLATLGVHPNLVNSITRGMGFTEMTDVQSLTINPALAGKDVVAQAKTGTGKTLAFLVPIVQKIIADQPHLASISTGGRARSDDIRAIVISPTRELAEQIAVEAKRLARGTGVIVQAAVGGTQKDAMLRKARREGCHLLIATPGRLRDVLEDPMSGLAAPNLTALVLDEADRMLEVGFKQELNDIVALLPDRRDVPRQTLLYSATLPKNVVGIARTFIDPQNFEFVQTVRADETPTHERVPQFIVPCRGFENVGPALLELVRREVHKTIEQPDARPFKAIVFLPTTASVVSYSLMFREIKYHDRSLPRILDIHSKLSQFQRSRNADTFRSSSSAILFSSDVTARGMDFPDVTHVIQVHLPSVREQYIHRLGRTGRAGKEGQGWLLVSDSEIPGARELLPGLPIQRCTDILAASVDATKETNLPREFSDVANGYRKLPYEVLADTYMSYLGGSMKSVDRQECVNEINNLSKYSYGMDQPPAVPRRLLQNFPRGIRGLRPAEAPSGRYAGRGLGRSGPGSRRPADRFEQMEQMAMAESYSRRRPAASTF
ncbi:hypothetical protein VTK26DRAFT_4074 [Humicola hyalothermophila]